MVEDRRHALPGVVDVSLQLRTVPSVPSPDGFQEYATRSAEGYENQGWKDAGEALVNSDGSLSLTLAFACGLALSPQNGRVASSPD